MLFHWLEGTNVGVDIEQFVGELNETLDLERFAEAWTIVADRHDILRTSFRWTGLDAPQQEVAAHASVNIAIHDEAVDLDQFLHTDRQGGFALDQGPLWRLTLFTATTPTRVVFTYHHSLLDTSVVWVVEEAFRTYDALVAGEEPEFVDRLPYREHLAWLSTHLDDNREAAQAYYRDLLDGYDEPISLRSLAATDTDQSGYRHDRFELTTDQSAVIHEFAEQHGHRPPVLIEAAWSLVLSAFSGSPDLVFGSTRGCRRSGVPGSENSVGLFINTPPVRLVLDPAETVAELLDRVRSQQRTKRDHEHTALTDIQAVAPVRGVDLFESIVVINEQHQGTAIRNAGPGFENRIFDLHDQTNTPLNLLAFNDPQIHFKLSYDLARFDPGALARLRELFVAVLEALATDPSALVASLPRVPSSDIDRLQAGNDTQVDYDHSATIVSLFEAQVDATPDATALIFRDHPLSYRELDERANAAAHRLIDIGLETDSMVGVLMDRSADMMVALLGILKAGAAYVPMDPQYPGTRIEMMLEDSAASIVFADPTIRSSVPATVSHIIESDSLAQRSPDRPSAVAPQPADLAYVIFTSGSTGRPKGVQLEHRNVVNFFVGMDQTLAFDKTADPGVWLAVTSISFDISVLELFWTLTRGFAVVIQEEESRLGHAAGGSASAMDFSLFYFASAADTDPASRYRLLIEGAKFADQNGFSAVWTPERHFHDFGGIYPNPAITSAAVAMVTERLSIRAGSVVLPLHNPIRCAEDWAVVDNLSNGRVGLSFASGWHANDFVLAPDNFENRRQLMADGIDTIRALWRGESVTATGGTGDEVAVTMFPTPIQTEPPLWVTAGGSPATFELAGTQGASILTNLLVMSEQDLVANLATYRQAYRDAGHEGNGHVSLMLHTFVGTDIDEVRDLVREPFLDYLRTSTDLINKMHWEQTSFAKAGLAREEHAGANLDQLSEEDMAVIMDHAFERYFRTAGLFGTPESCVETIERLSALGIDEVACLLDFGVDQDIVLDSLTHLNTLREAVTSGGHDSSAPTDSDTEGFGLIDQIERHGVTHFQCTPSHAAVIAATPGGLASLGGLNKFLLGGEALPQALADRLRPQIRGDLINMYGPTETTIWSSTSPILAAGQAITIGRPIANTHIHIVDPHHLPNPIGVAGELLIGGDGVSRGYLDRPELTAEKFVSLASAGGQRVYRTGDRARLLPTGEIEFGGRLDDQVKIRGYRIELGEIESVMGRQPGVSEAVVVARPDATGEPQLVGYVVVEAGDTTTATAWGELWDRTYAQRDTENLSFDATGWLDSYTGEPVPIEQMADWVDHTVEQIGKLQPKRILELGCGTGMLLFRLAPQAEHYLGIDLARGALDQIAGQAASLGLDQVQVAHGSADQLLELTEDTFDTIIINSVAQYFPNAEYFVSVVTDAMSRLEPGGSLFLGDLRSKNHAAVMAADIERSRATDTTTAAALDSAIAERISNDSELVIDPAIFDALRSAIPELDCVSIRLKTNHYDNEMSRFRFDAVLRRSNGPATPTAEPVSVSGPFETVEQLRKAATAAVADRPPIVALRGIPNGRMTSEGPINPAATVGLIDGYTSVPTWSRDHNEHFDLLLFDESLELAEDHPSAAIPNNWSEFTNTPSQRRTSTVVPELRAALRQALPTFMVPSAFVVLDSMPRTPNGKIDRKALPEPRRDRHETTTETVEAESDAEVKIAAVWENLLSLDVVGVETNVFDLGANSLLMVQASSQISTALDQEVTLVTMFRYPTVRSLAASLAADTEPDTAIQESQQRGANRREAMQRQRRARRGR